jgi:molecular chaperone GrpE
MNKNKDIQNQNDNKIQELETKLVEMENNWKRALADYTNQQKRFNEEREEIRTRANEILLLNLLPIVDNMEMLLQHTNDMGFKMIAKELQKVVNMAGLEEINTLDKKFDVTTMEAVDSKEGELNKVLETKAKGYLLNGKLIRPAKVVVGKNINKEEQK